MIDNNSMDLLRACSWCRKRIGQDNHPEGDELYLKSDVLKSQGLPLMTHGICSECYTRLWVESGVEKGERQ